MRCKGTITQGTMAYYGKLYGPEAVQRVYASLSPQDQEALRPPILASEWRDYAAQVRFCLALDKQLAAGDLVSYRNLGAFNADQQLRGIYRAFMAVASIEFMLKRVPAIWSTLYDTGRFSVASSRHGQVEIVLTDAPGIPLHHEQPVLGYTERAIELAGGKDPRGRHPECIARGDGRCLFTAAWR